MVRTILPNEIILAIARLAVPPVLVANAVRPPNDNRGGKIVLVNNDNFQSLLSWLTLPFSRDDILDETKKTILRIELLRPSSPADDAKPNLALSSGLLREITQIEMIDLDITSFLPSNEEGERQHIDYVHAREKLVLRMVCSFAWDGDAHPLCKNVVVKSFLTADLQELAAKQTVPGALARSWDNWVFAVDGGLDSAEIYSDYVNAGLKERVRSVASAALGVQENCAPLLLDPTEEDRSNMTAQRVGGWTRSDTQQVYDELLAAGGMKWVKVYDGNVARAATKGDNKGPGEAEEEGDAQDYGASTGGGANVDEQD